MPLDVDTSDFESDEPGVGCMGEWRLGEGCIEEGAK